MDLLKIARTRNCFIEILNNLRDEAQQWLYSHAADSAPVGVISAVVCGIPELNSRAAFTLDRLGGLASAW